MPERRAARCKEGNPVLPNPACRYSRFEGSARGIVGQTLFCWRDASGTTNYAYDGAGNLHTATDPAGGITTNTWDDDNRRTLAEQPSNVVNTFVYNGDGLRFQKQDSAGTTKFIWDDQNYLSELDGTNATTVLYTQTPDVYGLLIGRKRSSLAITEIYLFDALGSVSNIVISPLGGKLATYLYRAFGETSQLTGTIQSPFRWVGQFGYYYDLDLLEYYLRARDYSPALARFLSQDPMGFAAGDANWYRYVGNTPTTATDPSGLACPPPTPGGYGCFCGLGRKAACIPGPGGGPIPHPENPPPIDELDAACEAHDCCLAGKKEFFCEYVLGTTQCNKTFCNEIDKVDCDQIYANDLVAAYQCNHMKQKAKLFFC